MSSMLSDIRVVELGASRAAATAGKMLADCGTPVTKIVAPGRQLGPSVSTYFDHRKTTRPWVGVTDLEQALDGADILLCDLSEAQRTTLGIDLEALRRERPEIVVATMVPVHPPVEQPPEDPCGELAMQAGSGFMHMTGSPDREPLGVPYHLGCQQLGIHAAGAALAALLRRADGHPAPTVNVVGTDVLASYLRIYGRVSQYYDVELKRGGARAPGSGGRYPFGLFPCKDGHIAMIARAPRDWEGMLTMMGDPEWSTQPRYRDLHGIAMDYPDEVDELIAPWLLRRTRAELLDLAQQHQLPMAPVRRIDELTEDEQLRARGFFETVHIDGHDYVLPGRPWIETESPAAVPQPEPQPQMAVQGARR